MVIEGMDFEGIKENGKKIIDEHEYSHVQMMLIPLENAGTNLLLHFIVAAVDGDYC